MALDENSAEVKQRLDSLDHRVDEQFRQVDQRFQQVDQRFDRLESHIQKLRVLGEENTGQIRLIAEVQGRHGEKLDQVAKNLDQVRKDLAPLASLKDFVERIAGDHERRITALEQERK